MKTVPRKLLPLNQRAHRAYSCVSSNSKCIIFSCIICFVIQIAVSKLIGPLWHRCGEADNFLFSFNLVHIHLGSWWNQVLVSWYRSALHQYATYEVVPRLYLTVWLKTVSFQMFMIVTITAAENQMPDSLFPQSHFTDLSPVSVSWLSRLFFLNECPMPGYLL